MPSCPNPRCQTDYPPGSTQCTNPFCQCLLPEAVVAGRYRIETLIGLGGMGAVYRASDTFEIEQVALKILSFANNVMDMPTAVERFRREARYAHQLRHPNIVPVLNFGQDGSLLYLAMPLITGGTLKGLLKAERPLPTQQAQKYLEDLAAAIDAVHSHPQQIVHRDIKPSNLLIHQDDGRLMLADFGIARAMQNEKALTQRGWSLGTEHYIAPEQEQGKAETASDIYAMGVVAYQIFTGLLPFQAVVRSRATELPGPSTLNHALPPTIDTVLLRAIDIDPHKRYKTASDFVSAINDALAMEDIWSAPTLAATIVATSNANVIARTVTPENPCSNCGRENRSSSRFCRHCGHGLDETSPIVTDICQIGYLSDQGRRVQDNEDMLLVIQGLCVNLEPPPRPFSLLAVSDGLRGPEGKSAGGHEASRLAIETVADILVPLLSTPSRSSSHVTPRHGSSTSRTSTHQTGTTARAVPPDTILEQWLRDAARQANQVIYHCNADYDTSMASTLTTALLYKHELYVASIGDSRAYHYSKSKGLERITNDHTLAAHLVAADLLQPEEIYDSAKRHQHYRYLGRSYQINIDLFHQQVEPDDLILLCTDGLWHMIRDERLQELISQEVSPQELAHILVEEANNAGGEGNVSVIIARIG
ncbi:zinc-ribbon domain-containing protein [Ktedonosporobacter rubrisoli]|uniref:non-specific serine/threonine protein kinase n=1 Tax=Ktedonosporobacter rubrisoli TaxID=2509675 RepID=A0A4P6K294_KTERU|nr:protein kinase [Ktedonosporobacter rubrisoli]QBD81963.1 zinc-ribbon domain-containing protein [Ktedonosporobacter rubrisoli]